MSVMQPTTAGQPPAPESTRADNKTGGTEKAYGGHHFKPMIVPGLVGTGPILPEWLRKPFRRRAET
jgi:hypothetical protein